MKHAQTVSPRLEYYRKQAKALHHAQAAGDPQAGARFQRHHPRFAGRIPQAEPAVPLRLADAQLVVAREQGYPSWPRFQAHLREASEQRGPDEAAESAESRPSRPSLLIVDDERDFRDSLAEIFTQREYEVVTAATAQEALDHLGARSFNVALLDLRLPDMRGTEFMQRVRMIDRDLIIIIATAYASVDTSVTALHARAFWYFEKPLDVEKVEEILRRGLEEQEVMVLARRLLSERRGEAN